MAFPPDAPDLPSGNAVPNAPPFRGITLLLVEDSRFTCDAIRLMCQCPRVRLRRAESLAAERTHLACYRPDVMIVDLGLPDGRGEGPIADLAATRGLPFGISGDPEGGAPALAVGAAGFLEKPISNLAAFQRRILALVGKVYAMASDGPLGPFPGDPLALRDDLACAPTLIDAAGVEEEVQDYTASFLRCLGRAARDPALEAAAADVASDAGRAVLT